MRYGVGVHNLNAAFCKHLRRAALATADAAGQAYRKGHNSVLK
jgi:hypothetical protein